MKSHPIIQHIPLFAAFDSFTFAQFGHFQPFSVFFSRLLADFGPFGHFFCPFFAHFWPLLAILGCFSPLWFVVWSCYIPRFYLSYPPPTSGYLLTRTTKADQGPTSVPKSEVRCGLQTRPKKMAISTGERCGCQLQGGAALCNGLVGGGSIPPNKHLQWLNPKSTFARQCRCPTT